MWAAICNLPLQMRSHKIKPVFDMGGVIMQNRIRMLAAAIVLAGLLAPASLQAACCYFSAKNTDPKGVHHLGPCEENGELHGPAQV
jgi:hypothetical protein